MKREERWAWALLLLLLAAALARAAALAWVADDAFISLRYAEQLLAGHGLVYNAGERVEGYTNLLWTLLLAAAIGLGMEPLRAATWPGLVCYAALAGALALWSWRRARAGRGPFLPLAAGLVLVCDDFHVWATGGLETALFTALAVGGLLLTRVDGGSARPAVGAGALFALLVLTRPDGLLFAAAGCVSPLVPWGRFEPAERRRRVLATALPLAVTLAVLVPWKLAYYGELLPTAFYSKSALRPYFTQGLVYLGLYLAKNWFVLPAAALALWAWRRGHPAADPREAWDLRFWLASAALFTLYIVEVGGDFMASRRLLPAAPLLFLALEGALARLPAAALRRGLAVAVLVAAAFPYPLFEGTRRIAGVGNERAFYPPEVIEARRRQAEAVGEALAGTGARVAFEGGMCVFGYYSRLPYLVEITGLTQYSLAKAPLEERGAIGHEKVADDAWLREHGIHFLVSQALPPLSRPRDRLAVDEIYFGDLARARILIYSDEVMDALRGRPDVDFVPIERVIELSRRRMERAPPAEARDIDRGLELYYFDHAGPEARERSRELRDILEGGRRGGSR